MLESVQEIRDIELRARFTVRCEPSKIDGESQTQVLWKSSDPS